MTDVFAAAARVADAVLFEGYVLYPYRASAAKNRFRWQFGVLAPRHTGADDDEPSFSRTECVIEPAAAGAAPRLRVRVRFLAPEPIAAGTAPIPWLEGRPRTIDPGVIDLGTLPFERSVPVSGGAADAALLVRAEAAGPFIVLRLTLENRSAWRPEFDGSRDAMLQRSLVAAHLILALENGAFVSQIDPPPAARPVVERCRNRHTWPVLVGPPGSRALLLSSPIVLDDYPAVASESRGDLCDAAEIDEILSLRIMTLTDGEKAEARATDPRARAIVERVDAMTPDDFAALHGTMRSTVELFNPPAAPDPSRAFVMVGSARVQKGSHVRLRPNRRADAMDMFLRDQQATVAGVYQDVDDRVHVAVTVDADPGAAMHESFGRFFYFDPSEIEPLDLPAERV